MSEKRVRSAATKRWCVDRPLVFLRLSRRACLALLTHFALAFACSKNEKKITPVMQATNWLKIGPKWRGFLVLKLAVKKEFRRLRQAICLFF